MGTQTRRHRPMVPIRFIASIALTALVASCTADPMENNAPNEEAPAASPEVAASDTAPSPEAVSPIEEIAKAPGRVAGAVVASSAVGSAPVPASNTPAMQETTKAASYNELSKEETRILVNKGTEYPGTGALLENERKGTYLCRQCNAALYTAEDKFSSHCGWPSFDDNIEGRVKREADADGRRVEILCMNCDGHLGHVFKGEGYTAKNTRHCVNSVSMTFVPEGEKLPAMIQVENLD